MPLGPINQIAITTGPRAPPTAATLLLPYTNLLIITHKPITVHTLALSKEEGEGGARPPPQLLSATHPPVLKPIGYGPVPSN